jgi:hypothetical protein
VIEEVLLSLQFSLWELRKGRKSCEKPKFWSNVRAIDAGDCGALVQLVGTEDWECEIRRVVKKVRLAGVREAMDLLVKGEERVLKKVRKPFWS